MTIKCSAKKQSLFPSENRLCFHPQTSIIPLQQLQDASASGRKELRLKVLNMEITFCELALIYQKTNRILSKNIANGGIC